MAIIQLEGPQKEIFQEWFRWYEKQGVSIKAPERTNAFFSATQGIRPKW